MLLLLLISLNKIVVNFLLSHLGGLRALACMRSRLKLETVSFP
jgi:hypothetical protein